MKRTPKWVQVVVWLTVAAMVLTLLGGMLTVVLN